MDEVSLNRQEAEYQASILKVKTLGLDFQIEGEVAKGYRFTGVDSNVKSVPVEGLKSILASMSTLVVPGELLNIEGATGDVTVEVDLTALLPDNISITKDAAATAVITLRVEALEQRNLVFDTSSLELTGASEDLEYEFASEKVSVRIQGLTEDLDSLGPGTVSGRVDVTGLGEGVSFVEVQAELPAGFEWAGSDMLEVRITPKETAGPHESETVEDSQADEGNGQH